MARFEKPMKRPAWATGITSVMKAQSTEKKVPSPSPITSPTSDAWAASSGTPRVLASGSKSAPGTHW